MLLTPCYSLYATHYSLQEVHEVADEVPLAQQQVPSHGLQPTHKWTLRQHNPSHNLHFVFGQVPSHGLQTAHPHTNITSTHQPQLSLWPGTFSWPANRPFTQTSHLHNPSRNLHFGQVPSYDLQPTHSHTNIMLTHQPHTNITSTHQPQLLLWPGTFSWPANHPSTHKHHINTTPAFTLARYPITNIMSTQLQPQLSFWPCSPDLTKLLFFTVVKRRSRKGPANILPSTQHADNTAQPKMVKCLSSPSHFPSFFTV